MKAILLCSLRSDVRALSSSTNGPWTLAPSDHGSLLVFLVPAEVKIDQVNASVLSLSELVIAGPYAI
eukprot:386894-Pleurochrysis_carterae.AAC.1